MVDLEQYSGRKFAVILIDYSDNKAGEWYVVLGRAKINGGRLFVDRGTDTDFPIPLAAYDRVRRVTPDIASVVSDAEFAVTLTVGSIS